MIAAHGALSPAMTWVVFSPVVAVLLWVVTHEIREWWHRDDVDPVDLIVRDRKQEFRLRREAEGHHLAACRYDDKGRVDDWSCVCGRVHA